MSNKKLTQSMVNLENAILRLKEALSKGCQDELFIDGTIQRFEFTLELFWKTLKRFLQYSGIETNTPRETLKKAYSAHWLKDETAWLQMLNDRNLTSHVYDKQIAQRIYNNIKIYFPEFEFTFQLLQTKFKDILKK